MPRSDPEVTQLLHRLSDGDKEALDTLLPRIYEELRTQAHLQLRRGRPDGALNTTALVHEAYFKLVNHHETDWQDRSHFLSVAVRAMRQVIVDMARKQQAEKRGGKNHDVPLEDATIIPTKKPEVLTLLDEALSRLEEIDERQSEVVEFRFFGGFTIRETADLLNVSATTVKRDWRTAKAWLKREIKRIQAA